MGTAGKKKPSFLDPFVEETMYAKNLKHSSLLALYIIMLIGAVDGHQGCALASVVAIDGTWNGTTSRGYRTSFEVSSLGTQWSNFRLETDYIASTCGNAFGILIHKISGSGYITANEFSYSDPNFSFEGKFTSASTATGTYSFTNLPVIVGIAFPPYVCTYYLTQSGTWTATPIINLESSASKDGWILESSETSEVGGTMNRGATYFKVGDDADRKQYRAILSFNTSTIPTGAVINKVTLNVKNRGVVGGGNPIKIFHGFMVEIKKGSFGNSALELGDFDVSASKTYGSFSPKVSTSDDDWYPKGWYSINLTKAKNYINKRGLTQIRLRFKLDDNNDADANFLKLYSGNADSSNRPQLIVEYYVPK